MAYIVKDYEMRTVSCCSITNMYPQAQHRRSISNQTKRNKSVKLENFSYSGRSSGSNQNNTDNGNPAANQQITQQHNTPANFDHQGYANAPIRYVVENEVVRNTHDYAAAPPSGRAAPMQRNAGPSYSQSGPSASFATPRLPVATRPFTTAAGSSRSGPHFVRIASQSVPRLPASMSSADAKPGPSGTQQRTPSITRKSIVAKAMEQSPQEEPRKRGRPRNKLINLKEMPTFGNAYFSDTRERKPIAAKFVDSPIGSINQILPEPGAARVQFLKDASKSGIKDLVQRSIERNRDNYLSTARFEDTRIMNDQRLRNYERAQQLQQPVRIYPAVSQIHTKRLVAMQPRTGGTQYSSQTYQQTSMSSRFTSTSTAPSYAYQQAQGSSSAQQNPVMVRQVVRTVPTTGAQVQGQGVRYIRTASGHMIATTRTPGQTQIIQQTTASMGSMTLAHRSQSFPRTPSDVPPPVARSVIVGNGDETEAQCPTNERDAATPLPAVSAERSPQKQAVQRLVRIVNPERYPMMRQSNAPAASLLHAGTLLVADGQPVRRLVMPYTNTTGQSSGAVAVRQATQGTPSPRATGDLAPGAQPSTSGRGVKYPITVYNKQVKQTVKTSTTTRAVTYIGPSADESGPSTSCDRQNAVFAKSEPLEPAVPHAPRMLLVDGHMIKTDEQKPGIPVDEPEFQPEPLPAPPAQPVRQKASRKEKHELDEYANEEIYRKIIPIRNRKKTKEQEEREWQKLNGVRRKPGRPRKHPLPDPNAPKPEKPEKKPSGRPRKYPEKSDEEKEMIRRRREELREKEATLKSKRSKRLARFKNGIPWIGRRGGNNEPLDEAAQEVQQQDQQHAAVEAVPVEQFDDLHIQNGRDEHPMPDVFEPEEEVESRPTSGLRQNNEENWDCRASDTSCEDSPEVSHDVFNSEALHHIDNDFAPGPSHIQPAATIQGGLLDLSVLNEQHRESAPSVRAQDYGNDDSYVYVPDANFFDDMLEKEQTAPQVVSMTAPIEESSSSDLQLQPNETSDSLEEFSDKSLAPLSDHLDFLQHAPDNGVEEANLSAFGDSETDALSKQMEATVLRVSSQSICRMEVDEQTGFEAITEEPPLKSLTAFENETSKTSTFDDSMSVKVENVLRTDVASEELVSSNNAMSETSKLDEPIREDEVVAKVQDQPSLAPMTCQQEPKQIVQALASEKCALSRSTSSPLQSFVSDEFENVEKTMVDEPMKASDTLTHSQPMQTLEDEAVAKATPSFVEPIDVQENLETNADECSSQSFPEPEEETVTIDVQENLETNADECSSQSFPEPEEETTDYVQAKSPTEEVEHIQDNVSNFVETSSEDSQNNANNVLDTCLEELDNVEPTQDMSREESLSPAPSEELNMEQDFVPRISVKPATAIEADSQTVQIERPKVPASDTKGSESSERKDVLLDDVASPKPLYQLDSEKVLGEPTSHMAAAAVDTSHVIEQQEALPDEFDESPSPSPELGMDSESQQRSISVQEPPTDVISYNGHIPEVHEHLSSPAPSEELGMEPESLQESISVQETMRDVTSYSAHGQIPEVREDLSSPVPSEELGMEPESLQESISVQERLEDVTSCSAHLQIPEVREDLSSPAPSEELGMEPESLQESISVQERLDDGTSYSAHGQFPEVREDLSSPVPSEELGMEPESLQESISVQEPLEDVTSYSAHRQIPEVRADLSSPAPSEELGMEPESLQESISVQEPLEDVTSCSAHLQIPEVREDLSSPAPSEELGMEPESLQDSISVQDPLEDVTSYSALGQIPEVHEDLSSPGPSEELGMEPESLQESISVQETMRDVTSHSAHGQIPEVREDLSSPVPSEELGMEPESLQESISVQEPLEDVTTYSAPGPIPEVHEDLSSPAPSEELGMEPESLQESISVQETMRDVTSYSAHGQIPEVREDLSSPVPSEELGMEPESLQESISVQERLDNVTSYSAHGQFPEVREDLSSPVPSEELGMEPESLQESISVQERLEDVTSYSAHGLIPEVLEDLSSPAPSEELGMEPESLQKSSSVQERLEDVTSYSTHGHIPEVREDLSSPAPSEELGMEHELANESTLPSTSVAKENTSPDEHDKDRIIASTVPEELQVFNEEESTLLEDGASPAPSEELGVVQEPSVQQHLQSTSNEVPYEDEPNEEEMPAADSEEDFLSSEQNELQREEDLSSPAPSEELGMEYVLPVEKPARYTPERVIVDIDEHRLLESSASPAPSEELGVMPASTSEKQSTSKNNCSHEAQESYLELSQSVSERSPQLECEYRMVDGEASPAPSVELGVEYIQQVPEENVDVLFEQQNPEQSFSSECVLEIPTDSRASLNVHEPTEHSVDLVLQLQNPPQHFSLDQAVPVSEEPKEFSFYLVMPVNEVPTTTEESASIPSTSQLEPIAEREWEPREESVWTEEVGSVFVEQAMQQEESSMEDDDIIEAPVSEEEQCSLDQSEIATLVCQLIRITEQEEHEHNDIPNELEESLLRSEAPVEEPQEENEIESVHPLDLKIAQIRQLQQINHVREQQQRAFVELFPAFLQRFRVYRAIASYVLSERQDGSANTEGDQEESGNKFENLEEIQEEIEDDREENQWESENVWNGIDQESRRNSEYEQFSPQENLEEDRQNSDYEQVSPQEDLEDDRQNSDYAHFSPHVDLQEDRENSDYEHVSHPGDLDDEESLLSAPETCEESDSDERDSLTLTTYPENSISATLLSSFPAMQHFKEDEAERSVTSKVVGEFEHDYVTDYSGDELSEDGLESDVPVVDEETGGSKAQEEEMMEQAVDSTFSNDEDEINSISDVQEEELAEQGVEPNVPIQEENRESISAVEEVFETFAFDKTMSEERVAVCAPVANIDFLAVNMNALQSEDVHLDASLGHFPSSEGADTTNPVSDYAMATAPLNEATNEEINHPVSLSRPSPNESYVCLVPSIPEDTDCLAVATISTDLHNMAEENEETAHVVNLPNTENDHCEIWSVNNVLQNQRNDSASTSTIRHQKMTIGEPQSLTAQATPAMSYERLEQLLHDPAKDDVKVGSMVELLHTSKENNSSQELNAHVAIPPPLADLDGIQPADFFMDNSTNSAQSQQQYQMEQLNQRQYFQQQQLQQAQQLQQQSQFAYPMQSHQEALHSSFPGYPVGTYMPPNSYPRFNDYAAHPEVISSIPQHYARQSQQPHQQQQGYFVSGSEQTWMPCPNPYSSTPPIMETARPALTPANMAVMDPRASMRTPVASPFPMPQNLSRSAPQSNMQPSPSYPRPSSVQMMQNRHVTPNNLYQSMSQGSSSSPYYPNLYAHRSGPPTPANLHRQTQPSPVRQHTTDQSNTEHQQARFNTMQNYSQQDRPHSSRIQGHHLNPQSNNLYEQFAAAADERTGYSTFSPSYPQLPDDGHKTSGLPAIGNLFSQDSSSPRTPQPYRPMSHMSHMSPHTPLSARPASNMSLRSPASVGGLNDHISPGNRSVDSSCGMRPQSSAEVAPPGYRSVDSNFVMTPQSSTQKEENSKDDTVPKRIVYEQEEAREEPAMIVENNTNLEAAEFSNTNLQEYFEELEENEEHIYDKDEGTLPVLTDELESVTSPVHNEANSRVPENDEEQGDKNVIEETQEKIRNEQTTQVNSYSMPTAEITSQEALVVAGNIEDPDSVSDLLTISGNNEQVELNDESLENFDLFAHSPGEDLEHQPTVECTFEHFLVQEQDRNATEETRSMPNIPANNMQAEPSFQQEQANISEGLYNDLNQIAREFWHDLDVPTVSTSVDFVAARIEESSSSHQTCALPNTPEDEMAAEKEYLVQPEDGSSAAEVDENGMMLIEGIPMLAEECSVATNFNNEDQHESIEHICSVRQQSSNACLTCMTPYKTPSQFVPDAPLEEPSYESIVPEHVDGTPYGYTRRMSYNAYDNGEYDEDIVDTGNYPDDCVVADNFLDDFSFSDNSPDKSPSEYESEQKSDDSSGKESGSEGECDQVEDDAILYEEDFIGTTEQPELQECDQVEDDGILYEEEFIGTTEQPELQECDQVEDDGILYEEDFIGTTEQPELQECDQVEDEGILYEEQFIGTTAQPELQECDQVEDDGILYEEEFIGTTAQPEIEIIDLVSDSEEEPEQPARHPIKIDGGRQVEYRQILTAANGEVWTHVILDYDSTSDEEDDEVHDIPQASASIGAPEEISPLEGIPQEMSPLEDISQEVTPSEDIPNEVSTKKKVPQGRSPILPKPEVNDTCRGAASSSSYFYDDSDDSDDEAIAQAFRRGGRSANFQSRQSNQSRDKDGKQSEEKRKSATEQQRHTRLKLREEERIRLKRENEDRIRKEEEEERICKQEETRREEERAREEERLRMEQQEKLEEETHRELERIRNEEEIERIREEERLQKEEERRLEEDRQRMEEQRKQEEERLREDEKRREEEHKIEEAKKANRKTFDADEKRIIRENLLRQAEEDKALGRGVQLTPDFNNLNRGRISILQAPFGLPRQKLPTPKINLKPSLKRRLAADADRPGPSGLMAPRVVEDDYLGKPRKREKTEPIEFVFCEAKFSDDNIPTEETSATLVRPQKSFISRRFADPEMKKRRKSKRLQARRRSASRSMIPQSSDPPSDHDKMYSHESVPEENISSHMEFLPLSDHPARTLLFIVKQNTTEKVSLTIGKETISENVDNERSEMEHDEWDDLGFENEPSAPFWGSSFYKAHPPSSSTDNSIIRNVMDVDSFFASPLQAAESATMYIDDSQSEEELPWHKTTQRWCSNFEKVHFSCRPTKTKLLDGKILNLRISRWWKKTTNLSVFVTDPLLRERVHQNQWIALKITLFSINYTGAFYSSRDVHRVLYKNTATIYPSRVPLEGNLDLIVGDFQEVVKCIEYIHYRHERAIRKIKQQYNRVIAEEITSADAVALKMREFAMIRCISYYMPYFFSIIRTSNYGEFRGIYRSQLHHFISDMVKLCKKSVTDCTVSRRAAYYLQSQKGGEERLVAASIANLAEASLNNCLRDATKEIWGQEPSGFCKDLLPSIAAFYPEHQRRMLDYRNSRIDPLWNFSANGIRTLMHILTEPRPTDFDALLEAVKLRSRKSCTLEMVGHVRTCFGVGVEYDFSNFALRVLCAFTDSNHVFNIVDEYTNSAYNLAASVPPKLAAIRNMAAAHFVYSDYWMRKKAAELIALHKQYDSQNEDTFPVGAICLVTTPHHPVTLYKDPTQVKEESMYQFYPPELRLERAYHHYIAFVKSLYLDVDVSGMKAYHRYFPAFGKNEEEVPYHLIAQVCTMLENTERTSEYLEQHENHVRMAAVTHGQDVLVQKDPVVQEDVRNFFKKTTPAILMPEPRIRKKEDPLQFKMEEWIRMVTLQVEVANGIGNGLEYYEKVAKLKRLQLYKNMELKRELPCVWEPTKKDVYKVLDFPERLPKGSGIVKLTEYLSIIGACKEEADYMLKVGMFKRKRHMEGVSKQYIHPDDASGLRMLRNRRIEAQTLPDRPPRPKSADGDYAMPVAEKYSKILWKKAKTKAIRLKIHPVFQEDWENERRERNMAIQDPILSHPSRLQLYLNYQEEPARQRIICEGQEHLKRKLYQMTTHMTKDNEKRKQADRKNVAALAITRRPPAINLKLSLRKQTMDHICVLLKYQELRLATDCFKKAFERALVKTELGQNINPSNTEVHQQIALTLFKMCYDETRINLLVNVFPESMHSFLSAADLADVERINLDEMEKSYIRFHYLRNTEYDKAAAQSFFNSVVDDQQYVQLRSRGYNRYLGSSNGQTFAQTNELKRSTIMDPLLSQPPPAKRFRMENGAIIDAKSLYTYKHLLPVARPRQMETSKKPTKYDNGPKIQVTDEQPPGVKRLRLDEDEPCCSRSLVEQDNTHDQPDTAKLSIPPPRRELTQGQVESLKKKRQEENLATDTYTFTFIAEEPEIVEIAAPYQAPGASRRPAKRPRVEEDEESEDSACKKRMDWDIRHRDTATPEGSFISSRTSEIGSPTHSIATVANVEALDSDMESDFEQMSDIASPQTPDEETGNEDEICYLREIDNDLHTDLTIVENAESTATVDGQPIHEHLVNMRTEAYLKLQSMMASDDL